MVTVDIGLRRVRRGAVEDGLGSDRAIIMWGENYMALNPFGGPPFLHVPTPLTIPSFKSHVPSPNVQLATTGRRTRSETSEARAPHPRVVQEWRLSCPNGPLRCPYANPVPLPCHRLNDSNVTVPTRLTALKHGATLVWGPEIVDKAILHTERVVDRKHLSSAYPPTQPFSASTGVVSYHGKTRAMFTTHPIEKPYLIYQIGSASPELAVQAAKTVVQDVSGIDLNCGCPKPFSTHSGMGAALLTNPDLLCAILTALRSELPPEITVSAKIRLLPTQEETKKLVERIVRTGVSALTVHCRTRNMRERDAALVHRLREIVEFVQALGVDIAVIENGDCKGWDDAKRVKRLTGGYSAGTCPRLTASPGASSVMIATAAESNPTCFSSMPLMNLETTLIPSYLRLVSQMLKRAYPPASHVPGSQDT